MKKILSLWVIFIGVVYQAGAFTVENVSSLSSISTPTSFSANRYDWAKELQDAGDLTPFPDPPFYTTLLDVTSEPYGTKLIIESRPRTSITPIVLSLRLKGKTVTQAENRLLFVVNATSQQNFQHRLIQARQIWPTVGPVYTIPKDGSTFTIQLPDLVNQPVGVYAVWVITVDRILPGDIVEDGKVDLADFALLASQWMQASLVTDDGGNYLVSDLYLNRLTDLEDLLVIVDSWMEVE
jgi:hypothetical protein